jgi:DNA-binding NtrC family response regulator
VQGEATEGSGKKRIFHVSSRLNIMGLRDEILRMHGFDVDSTVYSRQAAEEVAEKDYDLVLIDVEADVRVQSAQELCDEIKKLHPLQHVAFVCNYRVAIDSDCPDEIIRAEFNPGALVRGVQQALGENEADDKILPSKTCCLPPVLGIPQA